jgi:hypothetical protein
VISINGVEQGGGGMQGKKGVTSDETGARKMRQRLEALVTYAGRVVAGGVLLCAGLALPGLRGQGEPRLTRGGTGSVQAEGRRWMTSGDQVWSKV